MKYKQKFKSSPEWSYETNGLGLFSKSKSTGQFQAMDVHVLFNVCPNAYLHYFL